jgi:hypothetical protein
MSDQEPDEPQTYVLTHLILGSHSFDIPSTKAEFDALRKAAFGFDEIVALENAYAANIENFIELEKGVTALIVANAIETFEMEAYDDSRRTAGRLIDNLLSSSRAFMDQCEKRLVKACGRTMKAEFADLKDKVKADSKAFRIMEILRNHAQHAGTSVTSITMGMRRVETEQEHKVVHTLSPLIQLRYLEADKRLVTSNPEGFEEIRSLATAKKGNIDLMPLIRGYIEGLSAILEGVRTILKPYEEEWAAADNAAFDRLTEKGGPKSGHAAVIRKGIDTVDTEELSRWNIERIAVLRKRHRTLKNHTKFELRH